MHELVKMCQENFFRNFANWKLPKCIWTFFTIRCCISSLLSENGLDHENVPITFW